MQTYLVKRGPKELTFNFFNINFSNEEVTIFPDKKLKVNFGITSN